ncbi:hypothetical protein [Kovacikia minuta]|nr:hypothetical protein [Kovacikia minuta]
MSKCGGAMAAEIRRGEDGSCPIAPPQRNTLSTTQPERGRPK